MAAHPARNVTADEIATFERDGAVALKGVYQPEWIDLLREGVDVAMATSDRYSRRIQGEGEPVFFTDYIAWKRVEQIKRFALEGPAAELGAQIMRSSKANFLFDGVFVKEPGTTKPSTWHQDQPYYCVQGQQIVVLWAPLDPCPASVSLQCVKGSHTWGKAFRPIKFKDGSDFGRNAASLFRCGWDTKADINAAYIGKVANSLRAFSEMKVWDGGEELDSRIAVWATRDIDSADQIVKEWLPDLRALGEAFLETRASKVSDRPSKTGTSEPTP